MTFIPIPTLSTTAPMTRDSNESFSPTTVKPKPSPIMKIASPMTLLTIPVINTLTTINFNDAISGKKYLKNFFVNSYYGNV